MKRYIFEYDKRLLIIRARNLARASKLASFFFGVVYTKLNFIGQTNGQD